MKKFFSLLILSFMLVGTSFGQCPTDVDNQGINSLVDENDTAMCDILNETERNIIIDTKVKADEVIKSSSLNLKYAAIYKKISLLAPASGVACTEIDLDGYNSGVHEMITGTIVGDDYSACSMTCPANYTLNEESALIACEVSCQDAFVNSLLDNPIPNATAYSGLIVSTDQSSCEASACSSGFAVNSGACVQSAPAFRSCLLADAQSNGWNTTNATSFTGSVSANNTATPNFSQCKVSACSGNRYAKDTTKSCETIPQPDIIQLAMLGNTSCVGNPAVLNWPSINVAYSWGSGSRVPDSLKKVSYTVHHSSNCSGPATNTITNKSPTGTLTILCLEFT
jgi:hypothetical protein